MSKFIRLGNATIKTDSIISAQFISVEYPYLNEEEFKNQTLARRCESAGGFGTIIGALWGASLEIDSLKNGVEMKTVKFLRLHILNGEDVRIVLIYNDKEFKCTFPKIEETYKSSVASKYGKACNDFYTNLTSTGASEMDYVEDDLDMFLARLEHE